jgi:hypothetical protein
MNVVVLGATGATGALVIVKALETSSRTTSSKISRADVATWLLEAATGMVAMSARASAEPRTERPRNPV